MKPQGNSIDRWSVYIAAGLLSFCGMMMFSMLPLVVSAMQRRYGFGEAKLGDMVGVFFAGVTLVSLTAFAWVRRFDWRRITTLGQAIGVSALFAMTMVRDVSQVPYLMFTAGVGFGITYSLALTVFGDSDDPDRAQAVNMFFQAFPSTVMIILLPMLFANDASDLRTTFVVMGATTLAISAGIFWLPRAGRKVAPAVAMAHTPASARMPLWPPILGTFITFLFMGTCTAPWTFMDQAVNAKGIEPVWVGVSLGGAQAASVVGAIIAAVIGDRYGRLWPVVLGVAAYVLGLYLLGISGTGVTFAVGACFFMFPANLLLAFSLGVTADADASGRVLSASAVSMLGPPLVLPSIAGRLYESYGFISNLALGALCALLGMVLYALLVLRGRRIGIVSKHEAGRPLGLVHDDEDGDVSRSHPGVESRASVK